MAGGCDICGVDMRGMVGGAADCGMAMGGIGCDTLEAKMCVWGRHGYELSKISKDS